MTTDREALAEALLAGVAAHHVLDDAEAAVRGGIAFDLADIALAYVRDAGEPVAWQWEAFECGAWEMCHAAGAKKPDLESWRCPTRNLRPLYAHPAPAQPVAVPAEVPAEKATRAEFFELPFSEQVKIMSAVAEAGEAWVNAQIAASPAPAQPFNPATSPGMEANLRPKDRAPQPGEVKVKIVPRHPTDEQVSEILHNINRKRRADDELSAFDVREVVDTLFCVASTDPSPSAWNAGAEAEDWRERDLDLIAAHEKAEAFKAGAEAMREAIVAKTEDWGYLAVEEVMALPLPTQPKEG